MNEKIKNDLYAVLKRFSIQQIYEHAIGEIPDIVWEDVVNRMGDKKKRENQSEIINIIITLISTLQLEKTELEGIIENLSLLALVATGSKTWHAYRLLDHKSRIPSTTDHFEQQLEKAHRKHDINAKVNVIDYQGKFVCSIAKRTSVRRRGEAPRYFYPIYFIFDPTTQYFFSTKLLNSDLFATSFCLGLGYSNFKYCNLSGRNVNDLLKLLFYKEKKKQHIDFENVEFVPKMKVKENGVDYTRREERRTYVNQLYGEEPPELQTLKFRMNDYVCETEMLEGKKFDSELKFVSHNVIGFIKDLVAVGVIDCPPPDYIKNVLLQGKNIFQTKSD